MAHKPKNKIIHGNNGANIEAIKKLYSNIMISEEVEVHCEYCQCPKEVWKGGSFKTYQGDECKLYYDFTNVISELEDTGKPFGNQDILDKCRTDFEKEYTDIQDFEATVNEMILINFEEGYMSSNYRPLMICK